MSRLHSICKETIGYAVDGTLMKDFIEYTNGDGSMTFHYNDVIWSDYEENIADRAVFTQGSPQVIDFVGSYSDEYSVSIRVARKSVISVIKIK